MTNDLGPELTPREAGRKAADMLAEWLVDDTLGKGLTPIEVGEFWLGVCDGAVERVAELRPELVIREGFERPQ